MGMNWGAIQRIAGGIIERYGTSNVTTAVLRRGTTDRTINVVVLQMTASERRGEMFQWKDQRILIDSRDLDIPPNHELDVLVLDGVVHKIIKPATVLRPDGATALYWEIFVRTVDR